jgi:hypothetical protein
MSDRFNWNTDESVVLSQQLTVAVYLGEHGDVIIRREGDLDIPDSFVSIRPHYAANRCAAILGEAGLHGPEPDAPQPQQIGLPLAHG